MIKTVFRDNFVNNDNWTEADGWLTFNHQLIDVYQIVFEFSSPDDIDIKLVTPDNKELRFYTIDDAAPQFSGQPGFRLDYDDTRIGVGPHDGYSDITITFLEQGAIHFQWGTFAGVHDFLFQSSQFHQFFPVDESFPISSYHTLKINSDDKESIVITKDLLDGDVSQFITGAGYHSLESSIEDNKPTVEPGYFYINNQEYYIFNDLEYYTYDPDNDVLIPKGLVLEYLFNEDRNDLCVNSGPIAGARDMHYFNGVTSVADGVDGRAVEFLNNPGVPVTDSAYMSMDGLASDNIHNSLTVSCNIKIPAWTVAPQWIFKFQSDNPIEGYPFTYELQVFFQDTELHVQVNSRFATGIDNPQSFFLANLEAQGFVFNEYNRFAFVLDTSGTITVYMNDEYLGEGDFDPLNTTPNITAPYFITVGGVPFDDTSLEGKMDEFTVWSKALSLAELTGTEPMPSGSSYIPGSPYFLIPSGNIDSTFGYVKTPSNYAYDVEWTEESDGTYTPTASGALPGYKLVYEQSDDARCIVPSGFVESDYPSDSVELPIVDDEAQLVLTDEVTTATTLENDSFWFDFSRVGLTYEFYTFVKDQYGSPMFEQSITWHGRVFDANNLLIDSPTGILSSDNRGVVTFSYTVPVAAKNVFIWSETNPSSKGKWIEIHLEERAGVDPYQVEVFQLDNPSVIWDSQSARTAMGVNMWEDVAGDPELWGTNTAEDTGVYSEKWSGVLPSGSIIVDFTADEPTGEPLGTTYINSTSGISSVTASGVVGSAAYAWNGVFWDVLTSTHGEWETYYEDFEYPPIHTLTAPEALPTETNGYFTIKDHVDYYKGIDPAYEDFGVIYLDMRVSYDGFWGHFIFTGAELKAAAGVIDIQNPAVDIYMIDRDTTFNDDTGIYTPTTTGSYNDMLVDSSNNNIYYVMYTPGEYNGTLYTTDTHNDIKTDVLIGARPCYFRGIGIYPIALDDGSNINIAYEQDWKIRDIIMGAGLEG